MGCQGENEEIGTSRGKLTLLERVNLINESQKRYNAEKKTNLV